MLPLFNVAPKTGQILIVLIQITSTIINVVNSQVAPQCVPTGLCFPQVPDLNPRIVTEGGANSTCPAGRELCYPKEGSFLCGTRYATTASSANGPTTVGSQPWQVYLMNQTNKYIGSGMLLTDRIVLTAAHKVYLNIDSPDKVQVYLGVNNPTGLRQPPAILRTAAVIVVHESFMNRSRSSLGLDYKDNVALIMLDRPVTLGYRTDVALGCLPSSEDDFVGMNCTVGGWGETQFQSKDEGEVHKQVTIPIVTMETCQASMARPDVLGAANTERFLDTERELCAGGQSNKDACTQDGGAPLMCLHPRSNRYVVAGLVNWGKGCGRAGVYGVYVDVTQYTDWINDGIASLA